MRRGARRRTPVRLLTSGTTSRVRTRPRVRHVARLRSRIGVTHAQAARTDESQPCRLYASGFRTHAGYGPVNQFNNVRSPNGSGSTAVVAPGATSPGHLAARVSTLS